MPARLVWTATADAELLRLREEGRSWDSVAWALGVSRNTVLARRHALAMGIADPPARTPHASEQTPPDRPPLPPGHPIAWAILTEGTCLAGEPYPLPVFA